MDNGEQGTPLQAHEQPDPTGVINTYTDAEPYTPEPEELELVAQLQTRFTEAADHRRAYDEEIEINYNVLKGDTIIAKNVDTGEVDYITLTDQSQQEWARRSSDNIIRNINRGLIGKHTRIIPAVEVIPATTDEADVIASHVATTALEAVARTVGMRILWVKAHRYMGWAGTGILEVFWDKEGGREIAWCERCNHMGNRFQVGDPCPACQLQNQQIADQQNAAIMQQMMAAAQSGQMAPGQVPEPAQPEPPPTLGYIREGEIGVKVHDPRNFYPEPGVDEIKDMRYACVAEQVPLSKVAREFPKMAQYLTPDSGPDPYKETLSSACASSEKRSSGFDSVILYQWHIRDSVTHPEGRLIYICNDIVMNQTERPDGAIEYGEPHPYHELPTLPFYPVRWERLEGRFWGESHITQSKWQQRARNGLLAMMHEQQVMTYKPPLLAAQGSQVSTDDFCNFLPGEVIKYNASIAPKPEYLPAPEFPQYTYEELERGRQSCMGSASVTDQEMGMSTGDPSGRYAAILEAQSSESLRAIIVDNAHSWLELHRAMLMLMQKYYTKDKIWTVRGKDAWMGHNWGAVELKAGWDIGLVETDSLSQNPALRLEQAQRLFQLGYFTDESTGMPDMGYFGRVAGIQDMRRGPDTDSNMRTYAKALPEMIMRGEFAGWMPWDDAEICAEELGGWLQGAGRKQPPDVQQMVGMVWQGYALAYAARQQSMGAPVKPNLMPNPGLKPQGPAGGKGPGGPQSNNVPGPPGQEASRTVKEADQMGERLANPGPHEG